jgi:hypothetical protein
MTDATITTAGPDHRAAFRAATFGDVLRSEWTKLRSVRSTFWALTATVVVGNGKWPTMLERGTVGQTAEPAPYDTLSQVLRVRSTRVHARKVREPRGPHECVRRFCPTWRRYPRVETESGG